MREHRGQEYEVKGRVLVRKLVPGGCEPPARVLLLIADIGYLEAEVWVPGGDVLLALGYAFEENVEPLVRAPVAQIPGERYGRPVDSASDVEHPLV